MRKKALFLDLDNTLYAVSSIAGELFAPIFKLLAESRELDGRLDAVKQDLMRKPFQWVAKTHSLSEDLTKRGFLLLRNAAYEGPIQPFPDYEEIRHLPIKKFLVTSGFQAMQESKINGMGIENDFTEIHIVDVETSSKKDVFAEIMRRYQFKPEDVLVIGDDPESEIKAAKELSIDAVLYDKQNRMQAAGISKISDFNQVHAFL